MTLTVGRESVAADGGRVSAVATAATRGAGDLTRATARVWLFAAMVVGAALRLVNLDAVGFNSDEVVYAGQAAALAGNPIYTEHFPVFRAHPMLVQSLLSVIYGSGEHDTAGRVLIALIGVATIGVVYLLGVELYDRRVGVLAAGLLAIMPYHVVVTRQVLLDGPMVFFATLTLLCVARFARTQRLVWLLAAGGAMGLTTLAKESSLVLVAGVYAFLALSPSMRRPVRGSLLALGVLAAVFLVHPVTQALAGHISSGQSYLIWQLLRRPNHDWYFYFGTVPLAVGIPVLLATVPALWWAWRRRGAWREVLLGTWIVVPVVVFTIWPVKGFQYLLPIAPALAVLAARGLLLLPTRAQRPPLLRGMPVRVPAACLIAINLLLVAVPQVMGNGGTEFLAGTGGVPGGREAGHWIATGTPAGATVLTLGPSMANIVQYYGHRRAYGLSVSPNPLHRNPAYTPIPNPDRAMRLGDLQYVVWDAYSAARSPFFSAQLNLLTGRYHGRVVHTEYVTERDGSGQESDVPVVVVYEVRP